MRSWSCGNEYDAPNRSAAAGAGKLRHLPDARFDLYNRENPRTTMPIVGLFDGDVVPFDAVETYLPRLPSLGAVWSF